MTYFKDYLIGALCAVKREVVGMRPKHTGLRSGAWLDGYDAVADTHAFAFRLARKYFNKGTEQ